MTTQEQLDQINSAISAILGGAQEYRIGPRSVTRGNLKDMLSERTRLEAKLVEESGGSVAVTYFDRR
jgi:hypothetical protein